MWLVKILNKIIKKLDNEGSISDGYHTFDELYRHRVILYITLCNALYCNVQDIWKSKYHSDGSNYAGWFILGVGKKKNSQITYHIPEQYWDLCDKFETLEKAPKFDGHTSDDVIDRLLIWFCS